ncbi:MAG: RNA polymerase sigma factor, partial [Pyrinomonadaceae bacterium]
MSAAAVAVGKEQSRADVFLVRYDRLLKWTLQITSSNRELAEDLVQEAFVQFTLAGPDPVAINNADHYLYTVLRNLHFSHLRRAARQRLEQLSSLEQNMTEDGRLAFDPRQRMRVQSALREVCRYACLRKETSLSGSVLILRFFHGYFPSEVAKLIRGSRNTVDVLLNSARREAQIFLTKPARPAFAKRGTTIKIVRGGFSG